MQQFRKIAEMGAAEFLHFPKFPQSGRRTFAA
jgi:hypothetical protein